MMSIDRKLWESPFYSDDVPHWPCPVCGATALEVVENSLHYRADTAVRRAWASKDFDSEPDRGVFSCIMRCAQKWCDESLAVSGRYETTYFEDEHGCSWEPKQYWPTSFTPAPPMIRVPDKCPSDVRNEIDSAFPLYWSDCGSCLNRLRNAIEMVLSDMGVKRFGKKKGGGRTRLMLDNRIKVLRSKKPALSDLCDRMLAVKHLCNAGSHPGQVEKKDVFDALDILGHIISEKYANPQSELAKMVRQINKRKGPRKAGT